MSTAAVALPAAPPLAIPEDPKAPFGVIALPDPTLPVTDAGIARAYAALCAHYRVPTEAEEREKAVRPIGAQLDKALALVLDRERWTLHDDHVALLGSEGDRYRTTPAFCEGPAWVSRGRRMTVCKGSLNARVGMCNHQLAVELLRLAQQLDHPLTPVFATDPAPTALVALPGWAIFALWGPITIAQRKGDYAPESVELLMEESYLSLTGGGFATTTACELSGAHTLIAIPVEGFQKLWEAIRPQAMETPMITLAGAVRLPNGIFAENSGSSNGTDILIFQKYAEGETPEPAPPWVESVRCAIPRGEHRINAITSQVMDYGTETMLGQPFVPGSPHVVGEYVSFEKTNQGRYGQEQAAMYVLQPPVDDDHPDVAAHLTM